MLAIFARKSFSVIAVLAATLMLSSCGFALLGSLKAADSTGKAVGDGMTKVIGKAIGTATACITMSPIASLSGSIPLEMEQKDFDQFQQLIENKSITKGADFLYFLSASDRKDLRAWITQGYDLLSADSSLRKASVTDYMNIFANGMIQAHKQPQVAKYKFFSITDLGEKKLAVYALTVTLTGTTATGYQSYGQCK